MWVRLTSLQHIERSGKLVTFHPGDWIEVGRQQAQLWMSRGDAEVPSYENSDQTQFKSGELGIVITGIADQATIDTFIPFKDRVSVTTGEARLPFNRTLIWDGACKLRRELMFVGFSLLDTWNIACPLWSYDILASQVGSVEDREETKKIVRDLRVPLYDTRLMYVKKCEETEELLKVWRNEWKEDGETKLAFLRAFYKVKPLMLALPITWIDPKAIIDD